MGCQNSRHENVKFKTGIKFSQIKDQIKPLDLIVFRGNEYVSDLISLIEKDFLGNGDWTHVGLVITPEILEIENGQPGQLYIWESTMSGQLGDGVNDVESKKGKFGVQIRHLGDVIDQYDKHPKSRIGWCPLINNPLLKKIHESDDHYLQRKMKIINLLQTFHQTKGHVTYDYNLCNLCSTVCCTCTETRRCLCGRSNKMFCSELVATIYEMLGIMPNIDPVRIAPVELLGYTNDHFKSPVRTPATLIIRESID